MTAFCEDEALEEYRYLLRRAARRFERRWTDRDDLEQIAAIGLLKAIRRYDPVTSKGAPFEAYAWRLIFGELMHWARDNESLVRVPRTLRSQGLRAEVIAISDLNLELAMPSCFDDVIDRDAVQRMLAVLDPVQRTVVVAIDIAGLRVTKLAAILGFSRRHVTRLHRSALNRLRDTVSGRLVLS